MPGKSMPDGEFIELVREIGCEEIAKRTGLTIRGVYKRRANLEKKHGPIATATIRWQQTRRETEAPQRFHIGVKDGVVLVGSDSHYWPGRISTAHRAFVFFAKKLKPVAVIKNGDALDGATISRHTPIGWEKRPSLIDEIEECKARMEEIRTAAKHAVTVWTLGNHDARFETRLATVAPEYARINGVHLRDHFPDWEPAWACWINNDVVIKHRYKSGIHAPHNNTMWAGKTMVTGHLHSLKVMPITDYNGTRYGVDCGTMADVYGPQFTDYTEDSPRNWRSGFAVLTFRDGRLTWPEVVHVIDADHVEFRGEVYRV